MSLRARLALFFVGIVVVPLLIAAFILRGLLTSEVERRTDTRLEGAARAATALWDDRLELALREVRQVAARIASPVAGPGDLRRLRTRSGLDFLVLQRRGEIVALSGGRPDHLRGVDAPSVERLVSGEAPGLSLRARVPAASPEGRVAVTGGWFADADLAADLAALTGLEVTLVERGESLASTAVSPPTVPQGTSASFELPSGGAGYLVPLGGDGGIALVASTPEVVPTMPLWIVMGVALALAVLLGWTLASLIARPLDRLAEGARAVAAGNLDARIEGEGRVDVGHLAEAFNSMTASIRTHVEELRSSRDELRGSLERFGATLRSTHDLQAMLEVVLDTAAITLRASAGALFLGGGDGRSLRLEVARGYEPSGSKVLAPGHGIAGRAGRGEATLVPGDPAAAEPGIEPSATTAIAVPLIRWDRMLGVVALYGRTGPEPFERGDLDTLASFAAQASVAIENVLLHEEAERLSITDSLTGIFNRRYLELTMRREIERAQRFGRSLSLLMVDIDHFKDVNDEHGHQRGDEVLSELSRRVMGLIRTQIDHFARYGGEEFVLLLPETTCEAALQVGERVREAVAGRPFTSATGPRLSVTVSVGAAAYPDDGDSADDLLRAADGALYRAKERGRNRTEPAGRLGQPAKGGSRGSRRRG